MFLITYIFAAVSACEAAKPTEKVPQAPQLPHMRGLDTLAFLALSSWTLICASNSSDHHGYKRKKPSRKRPYFFIHTPFCSGSSQLMYRAGFDELMLLDTIAVPVRKQLLVK
jgi:hypothetical protein